MNHDILIALINNAALLVMLGVIYDRFYLPHRSRQRLKQAVTGVILGGIGIAVMLNAFKLPNGIIFDTRSILLSLTGLYLGWLPTLIATGITALFRWAQGGAGVVTGVTVIATSAAIGLIWRVLRRRWMTTIRGLELYAFGLIVNSVMLLTFKLTFPPAIVDAVIATVSAPILLIYPIVTVLLGLLLSHQRSHRQAQDVLKAQERRLRKMVNQIGDTLHLFDANRWDGDEAVDCRRILGLGEDAHENKPPDILMPPEIFEKAQQMVVELMNHPNATVTLELQVANGPEGNRWREFTISNLQNDPDVGAMVTISRDITERKRMETTLAEREATLRNLFETAPVGIFQTNAQGQVIAANQALAQILGFPSPTETIAYFNDLETQLYVDPSRRVEFIRLLNEQGTVEQFEYQARRPDGRMIWISMNARINRYRGEHDFLIDGFSIDITERKRTEAALQESEARHKALFENHHAVMLLLDSSDGAIVDANPAACAFYGWSRDDLRAMNINQINMLPPEELKEKLESARNHKQLHFFFKHRLRSGEVRDVESFSGLIVVNNREMIYSIIHDISERRLAETALLAKTEELDQYFNNSLDLLCIADRRGYFRRLNPQWEAVLGFPVSTMIGNHFSELIHPDDREATEDTIAQLGSRTNVLSFINRHRHADGRYRWLEWRLASDGDLIFAVARDITEQRKMEIQLRQAQKMEAVGRLAGGVAHDFNNMLNVILGYADLVREQLPADSELVHDIHEIMQAAERSANLTRQLLAFSRQQIIEPKIVNLNKMIDDQQKMLSRLIGEEISLNFLPDEHIDNILIDPSQIDQILANLAINARDAINGVGTVTIETTQVVLDEQYTSQHLSIKPGTYVLLVFSDTGPGMNAQIIEHIFEPFFTTKKAGEGTGLGLATIYGIMEQIGGCIHAYSEPGMGTTFKLYFPRVLAEQDAQPEVQPTVFPCGHEVILLVEDEPQILGLAKIILEKQGYVVLTSNSPKEACQLVENYPGEIHLLLSDVVMPEMSGKEMQERIVRLKPAIKTLFMSGYTANIIVHRGVLDEGINFLHKPFSIHSLIQKVHEVLTS